MYKESRKNKEMPVGASLVLARLQRNYQNKSNNTSNSGITLIALIITIIILLILAMTSIALIMRNGIINHAQTGATEYQKASEEEIISLAYDEYVMDSLNNENADLTIEEAKSVKGDKTNGWTVTFQSGNVYEVDELGNITGPTNPGTRPEIPEGLKVGSEVTYNPNGTYTWQAKYCSSTKTEGENVELSSGADGQFNISSWKVLSIEEGKVELVPKAQTTGTVYLEGAQGYNNAVKLLNDACSALYGKEGGEITARSISMEDIEKYMTDTAISEAHASPYDTQPIDAYTQEYNWYPAIYAQENKAVINGETKSNGLGMSKQSEFLERTASVGDTTTTDGEVQAKASIQPYTTYWYKDASSMASAFESYDNNGGNYYSLIMPSATSTTYWVASRCVGTYDYRCDFCVRSVSSGAVCPWGMVSSNYTADYDSRALFPVVTLSSKLIKSEGGNYKVE